MTFHVGQKVVCVRRTRGIPCYGEILPAVGSAYTVRSITTYNGDEVIRLGEITNKPNMYDHGFVECSFYSYRFRPIVERKTSIAIFTAMLVPSSSPRVTAEI